MARYRVSAIRSGQLAAGSGSAGQGAHCAESCPRFSVHLCYAGSESDPFSRHGGWVTRTSSLLLSREGNLARSASRATIGLRDKLLDGVTGGGARLFDTGHNRKSDAHDAHAVAAVAVRTDGLRVLSYDVELEALRMLADRREELTQQRIQTVNRLQRLLSELIPGKAKKDITALQAKAILASMRPRDMAGKTRRRLAVEQLTELVAVEKKIKALTAELKAMVIASGSRLMDHVNLNRALKERAEGQTPAWSGTRGDGPNALPLSTYTAVGGLRQDPCPAAQSTADVNSVEELRGSGT